MINTNYNAAQIARCIRRAQLRQRKNERKARVVTACIVCAAVVLVALLLAGAWRAEREYSEDVVIVRSGDTLWGLAEMYCPNDMDKRDYVRTLQSDNDCGAVIRAGDVLTVRVYD